MLRTKVIGIGGGGSVTREDKFLASQVEAHLVVAKAVYQLGVPVLHVLHPHREADGHSVLLDAVGGERLVVTHCPHVLCYAQGHDAVVGLRAIGCRSKGVLHESIGAPVGSFHADGGVSVLDGLVLLAVGA